jgi:Flp pilus assembly protein TadG
MLRSFLTREKQDATFSFRAKGGRRRAVAAAEFAIIAPLVGTLILGMFELGRGIVVKQIVCNAARKGCRTGILHQYGSSDIVNDAVNVMRDNGFDATKFDPSNNVGSVTITVTDPNGNTLSDALDAPPGSTVSVQVSIPVSSIFWVSTIFLTASSLDSDTVVMMKQ